MQSKVIKIKGISSKQDADKLLKALEEVWGVRDAKVNTAKSQATVNYDESAASFEDFQQAILESGFDISTE